MSMTINTNIVSLNAQRNLSTSQMSLATSMQRLSSGLRVNSAKDDAAGLAIADRMNAQIRGTNVAIRNANDGISLAQTAEGALATVTDALQRMRELAVQAQNGSNGTSDRANLDTEYQALSAEITRIAAQTKFNGVAIVGARAGLLSDVQFYEEYPSSYAADVARRHRWIRGDWQIVRWMLPGVPAPGVRFQRNPLSGISRWKIFDNLRRSLVPPGLTLLLALGWTVLAPVWFWTLAVIGIILLPALMAALLELFRKPDDAGVSQHLVLVAGSLGRHCVQAAFTFACLPYEAFYSMDAILRTVGRMLVTRRRLLEWSPSSAQDRHADNDLRGLWKSMWAGPAFAAAAGIYLTASSPGALLQAASVLWLWLASPSIARRVSLPPGRRKPGLTADQTIFLGRSPARPGASSRHLSEQRTIGCRRITFRSTRSPSSRIAPRRPI